MGNNRSRAVISNQIAIMMRAAIESIAREGVEDVDERENDIETGVHNWRDQRQARGGWLLSTLNTYNPERLERPLPAYLRRYIPRSIRYIRCLAASPLAPQAVLTHQNFSIFPSQRIFFEVSRTFLTPTVNFLYGYSVHTCVSGEALQRWKLTTAEMMRRPSSKCLRIKVAYVVRY